MKSSAEMRAFSSIGVTIRQQYSTPSYMYMYQYIYVCTSTIQHRKRQALLQ